jgi:long-chain acyl-CoA synthetase
MANNFSLHGADGFKPPAATLCAMFDHAVAAAPDSVALRYLDAVLTYRELGCAVEALAQRLATMVEPGDIVALVLPDSIEFHLAYFAALKVRAPPALLNPVYPAAELSRLACAARCERVLFEQGIAPEQPTRASSPRGTESLRTLRWRELDSNFRFRAR